MTVQEKYDIGFPILKQLSELPSKELKVKLAEICGSLVPDHIFDETACVKKFIIDDEPEQIQIWNYDCLTVTPFGINFNPEHRSGKTIIEFNKFFKL